MSRTQISKHYTRILTKWPVDKLRPEVQFQSLLRKRIESAPVPSASATQSSPVEGQSPARQTPAHELKEINALYSLLGNRYSREFPLSQSIMHPTSTPEYYDNLAKELEELPNRSRWGHFIKRLQNMVRLQ